jgi:nitrite reductase/ring-hydroxylating ferredoxin subunit
MPKSPSTWFQVPRQLESAWFAIERSVKVQSEPVARQIQGAPVVLVRDADGEVLALEDRCPHRAVPLSHGRLGPLGLVCRNHGWSFDRHGHCTFMPGMSADMLGEIRVKSYQVQELDGLIWISSRTTAPMPPRVTGKRRANPPQFLWDGKWLEPAAVLRLRLADRGHAEGSILRIETPARLGCKALITLCFTPETPATCRVFAIAHVETRWLPSWIAKKLTLPLIDRLGSQQALLGR